MLDPAVTESTLNLPFSQGRKVPSGTALERFGGEDWGPFGRNDAEMLWSFHRGGEHLVYEIRNRIDAPGFELIIRRTDGSETVELFDDHTSVDRRAEELQRDLLHTGWWLAGDPRR
jgi:hypothetical protein